MLLVLCVYHVLWRVCITLASFKGFDRNSFRYRMWNEKNFIFFTETMKYERNPIVTIFAQCREVLHQTMPLAIPVISIVLASLNITIGLILDYLNYSMRCQFDQIKVALDNSWTKNKPKRTFSHGVCAVCSRYILLHVFWFL